jgi:large subunit ribosomal protein L7/L12
MIDDNGSIDSGSPIDFGNFLAAPAYGCLVIEEREWFDVILESIGPNRIHVIKWVKESKHCSLFVSKELVERAPTKILSDVYKLDANVAKCELEKLGATVRLI